MKIDAGKLGKQPVRVADSYLSAMFSPGTGCQSTEVPLERLTPWEDENHRKQPFRPYSPEKLSELAENIKQYGVLSPVYLRPWGGGYQILAGHNRVAAAKLAGLTAVPAIIRQMDDDTAKIIMTDSNLYQREKLLPSEKAWAYRIRMESIKRQGQRNDLTSTTCVAKLRSDEQVGSSGGESRETVRRYIRLTYLVPPLLNLVDEEKMLFMAGVSLSYLKETDQTLLWSVMSKSGLKTISRAQADELKTFSDQLDEMLLLRILGLTKGPDKPRAITLKIPSDTLPSDTPKAILSDPELQRRVAQVVAQFILEREGGDAV